MSDEKRPAPLVDDLGRPIQGAMKDRTIVRKQGCYNCRYFDTEAEFRRIAQDRFHKDVKAYQEAGYPRTEARNKARGIQAQIANARGAIGICRAGKVETHFVSMRHLCGTWTACESGILSDVRSGGMDPLVEELYDIRGESPDGGVKE